MGHYGCKDLLSILSSAYSAFFTVHVNSVPDLAASPPCLFKIYFESISIIKRSGELRYTEGGHAFVTEYYKNLPCILKDNSSHRLLNSFQQFQVLTYTWKNIFSFILTTSSRLEGWKKRCLLRNLLFTRPVFHRKNKWNYRNVSPLLLYLLKFLGEKLERQAQKRRSSSPLP